MLRLIATVALATSLALVTGCGGQDAPAAPPKPKAPKTFQLTGTFTLASADFDGSVLMDMSEDYSYSKGVYCEGGGGYSDIAGGAQVVVTSNAGRTLAVGALSDGKMVTGMNASEERCEFALSVDKIPTGKGPYAVEVSSRGQQHFTEDNPFVQLTLG